MVNDLVNSSGGSVNGSVNISSGSVNGSVTGSGGLVNGSGGFVNGSDGGSGDSGGGSGGDSDDSGGGSGGPPVPILSFSSLSLGVRNENTPNPLFIAGRKDGVGGRLMGFIAAGPQSSLGLGPKFCWARMLHYFSLSFQSFHDTGNSSIYLSSNLGTKICH